MMVCQSLRHSLRFAGNQSQYRVCVPNIDCQSSIQDRLGAFLVQVGWRNASGDLSYSHSTWKLSCCCMALTESDLCCLFVLKRVCLTVLCVNGVVWNVWI